MFGGKESGCLLGNTVLLEFRKCMHNVTGSGKRARNSRPKKKLVHAFPRYTGFIVAYAKATIPRKRALNSTRK